MFNIKVLHINGRGRGRSKSFTLTGCSYLKKKSQDFFLNSNRPGHANGKAMLRIG